MWHTMCQSLLVEQLPLRICVLSVRDVIYLWEQPTPSNNGLRSLQLVEGLVDGGAICVVASFDPYSKEWHLRVQHLLAQNLFWH